jgi:hypothetical protein
MPTIEERVVKVETTQDEHTRLLTEILDQAKLTNGTVRELQLWRARVGGATAAMSWVQPLVVAVVSGGLVAVLAVVLPH